MNFVLEVALFIIGGIVFLISHTILKMEAFRKDRTTYDWRSAINNYQGKNKPIVLVGWFGGPILMLIGIFVFVFCGGWDYVLSNI